MPNNFPRLTLPRLMLAILVMAILFGWIGDHVGRRRSRSLEIADRHARLGAEYRRNSGGDPMMLRTADWHELMRGRFEDAAVRFWEPLPVSKPSPPDDWSSTRMITATPTVPTGAGGP